MNQQQQQQRPGQPAMLTMNEIGALHHLRRLIGEDLVQALHDKERELFGAWHVLAPGSANEGALKKSLAACFDKVMPARHEWNRFSESWRNGKASVADLNRQIEIFNALPGAKQIEKLEHVPLVARLARIEGGAAGADVAELRAELAALRAEVAELRDAAGVVDSMAVE